MTTMIRVMISSIVRSEMSKSQDMAEITMTNLTAMSRMTKMIIMIAVNVVVMNLMTDASRESMTDGQSTQTEAVVVLHQDVVESRRGGVVGQENATGAAVVHVTDAGVAAIHRTLDTEDVGVDRRREIVVKAHQHQTVGSSQSRRLIEWTCQAKVMQFNLLTVRISTPLSHIEYGFLYFVCSIRIKTSPIKCSWPPHKCTTCAAQCQRHCLLHYVTVYCLGMGQWNYWEGAQ